MKYFFYLISLLFLPLTLRAEDISVWNMDDGYMDFDVKRKDRSHFEIYDYTRGSYLDAEVKHHGHEVEVYDYASGSYKTYDLDKQPNGGLEVYDYETGKYFDIDSSEVEKFKPKEHDCDHRRFPALPVFPSSGDE